MKEYRKFQLICLGWIAIGIAPVVLFFTMVIHRLPFLKSISESGTIANAVSPILPFCLGALALFSLTYAIKYKYDKTDVVLTSLMFAGFTAVAMQMCLSPYILGDKIGVLGLPPGASGIVHNVGALAGFGGMILWITFCFTKSDKRKHEQTKEKRERNLVYRNIGICMIASLAIFILDWIGLFGGNFPTVFIVEAIMLTFGGGACLIKGGMFLKDK